MRCSLGGLCRGEGCVGWWVGLGENRGRSARGEWGGGVWAGGVGCGVKLCGGRFGQVGVWVLGRGRRTGGTRRPRRGG